MQVLGPDEEVQGGQEDLPGRQAVPTQLLPVGTDQGSLAYRRHGLEGHRIPWTAIAAEAQLGQAGGDRPRCHDDHAPAAGPQGRHLVAQLGHHGAIDDALVVGYRRGPDLHYGSVVPSRHQSSS